MKLSSFVAYALATSTVSLAASPSSCDGTDKKRNGADFVLTAQPDNAHVAALSKFFTSAKRRVSVAHVFDDGNHKMTTDAAGKRAWEKTKDFNDQDTKKWVPQGITSTADALEAGTYEGKDGWVVTWHRDDDKSVRVTFVEKASNKYRHALLVYPFADDDFREVPVHAGGVMWYGDTLWVVDTKNGIRVFDMSNIWEVEDGEKVGKMSAGHYSAAGYKYVIPQIRWYKQTSDFNFQFSFIALDRTTSPDRLLVGEYQKKDTLPIRMAQWELDYTTRKLKTGTDGKTAKAVWAYCTGIVRTQGAVQANGKIYISRSNGDKAGDIFGWIPGKIAHNNEGFVPPSPEDLSFDKRGSRIYGLTEQAGGRYILTLDSSKVKFS
ncbi:hypothetical protein QQS21_012261 [Conoideocrella luteorostrata]|uniref:Secreted protein n=1 Tax=Conoideocrella luteorostrata TaxID=1105319 RepID=A0AAJ0CE96_9HYPO|nr:hypothetical protein QQS21_012261 [Conoideocrella luteorostrata]